MEKIETIDVMKAVIDRHFIDGVDWRSVDEKDIMSIPRELRAQCFVWRSEFYSYLADAFDCSAPTKKSKWDNLVAQEIIISVSRSYNSAVKKNDYKGFINLSRIKTRVPEYSEVSYIAEPSKIKKTNTKKTQSEEVRA